MTEHSDDGERQKSSVEESLDSVFVDPERRPRIETKELFLSLPVMKPKKGIWFRVHPGSEFEREVYAVEDPSDNSKLYIVHPNVAHSVDPHLLQSGLLVAAITRQAQPFVWPLRLPNEDGQSYDAWDTALAAARIAREKWLTIWWDREASRYVTKMAIDELESPQWPTVDDFPFTKWVKTAFKDRIITDPDHVLLKTLRGERQ